MEENMTITKSQINVQDQFLNQIRKDRHRVTIELTNGRKVEGVVIGFDNFSLVLRGEKDQSDELIYKHAISTVLMKGKMAPLEIKG
jgi:host factor-I protein